MRSKVRQNPRALCGGAYACKRAGNEFGNVTRSRISSIHGYAPTIFRKAAM